MKPWAICGLAVILTGCQPTIEQQCTNSGVAPGTADFQDCVTNLTQQRQQALMALANMYANRSAPQPSTYYIPDNRTINTNCYGGNGSYNCTSQRTGVDTSIYNNIGR
jgi:hypothetical protein